MIFPLFVCTLTRNKAGRFALEEAINSPKCGNWQMNSKQPSVMHVMHGGKHPIDQTLLNECVVGVGFLRLPHGDFENMHA